MKVLKIGDVILDKPALDLIATLVRVVRAGVTELV